VASLSQGRTAAAQCGLFTYKSVPVIFEPPCIYNQQYVNIILHSWQHVSAVNSHHRAKIEQSLGMHSMRSHIVYNNCKRYLYNYCK